MRTLPRPIDHPSKMRAVVGIALPVVALALLAAALFIPRLFDATALRDTLAGQLSTALGRPVSIERLDIRLLPQPAVVVENLAASLGDGPDAQLHIGRIQAAISVAALLDRHILVSQLDIETLTLNAHLIGILQSTLAALNSGTRDSRVAVRLNQARIDDLVWKTASGLELGPYTATLDWAAGKVPERIAIAQTDGRVRADLSIVDGTVDIDVHAADWTTPVFAPLRQALQVARLEARARYTDRSLEVFALSFAGPIGKLHFNGVIDWRAAWRVDAALSGTAVDLSVLLTSFGQDSFPGRADGTCGFKLQAVDPHALLRQPALDCNLRHTHDRRTAQISLTTQPAADAMAYQVRARDVRLPVGPPLHFDTLDMRGRLTADAIRFDAVHSTGYQGELAMQGSLSWSSGWQWIFTAQGTRLHLDPLLAVFDQHKLDGRLDSTCEGKLGGATFTALLDQPRLRCSFMVADGTLRNADLEQAARLFKTAPAHAGSTPFDRLSGRLTMQSGQSRLSELQLTSSALEAKGSVTITADERLSGELNAGLKNTGGMVSVPLTVTGVVGEPVIRPTTSAMAGGAAGTVLLGPGVGTAVGVKVGEALGKMTRWLRPKRDSDDAAVTE